MNRNQQEALLALIFGSASPPHQLIVFAFRHLLGWKLPQIKEQLFTSTLGTLLTRLEEQCSTKFEIPLRPYFEVIRERLGHALDRELSQKKTREIYGTLLGQTGETISLGDFSSDIPGRDHFNSWWHNIEKTDIEDLHLVLEARQGTEEAFKELRARHQRRLTGYIRPRVDDDSEIEDVAQTIWLEVWLTILTFDPVHGNFESFLINTAKNKLRRLINRKRPVLILMTDLLPEDGTADEEGDLIESLATTSQSPEIESMVQAMAYTDLFKRVFGGANPPHQLISFGFCKLLEFKPSVVVAELSEIKLRTLAKKLEEDYYIMSKISREVARDCFQPLHDKMDLRCAEAMEHPRTIKTYSLLKDQIVGNTTLRDYYTKKPEANIANWWEKVRKRVRNELMTKKRSSLTRSHK